MSRTIVRRLALIGLLLLAAALSGCTNPDAPTVSTNAPSSSSPQNAGEPAAPAPSPASTQQSAGVQGTAVKALEAFAALYTNWTYKTLAQHQRTLAAISVGPARLAEQQAAVSSASDTTIPRGHIYNEGQVVSIAPDLASSGSWVIVTREQTGGGREYEGLVPAYHVTIAKLASVPGGWAVQQWLPQS